MSTFYISGMTEDEHGGIFRCQWRNNTVQMVEFTPLRRNSFLAWSRDRRTVYASMQQETDGGAAAYRVQENGALEHLNTVFAGGRSVCYLEVSPDGKYLYSANYASGNISEFLLDADGVIARLNRTVSHYGSGVRTEQRSPHPHCCTFTPDGKFLCVVDLGIDRVKLYPFIPEQGLAVDGAAEIMLPPGCGPRHLVFAPDGKMAFLLCELGNKLFSFRYENGVFTLLDKVSTLPEACHSGSAAAIRLVPDGSRFFVSNRGSDTLAAVTFDDSGKLTVTGFFPAGGASPRDFNFLPGAEIVAVANEFSGKAVFFAGKPCRGQLGAEAAVLNLPRPLYVLV